MTLTEEQREAIRVISKLPMAIGCQLCHPYIMKNYGSHFIVLRDMIDSSGTVEPTGGFDLEKARAADEALPYPLDANEIWVSGKGQMHINPPNAPSIFFTLSDLCEFRNLFHGQAAEIERLRAENLELQVAVFGPDGIRAHQACIIADQAASISELEIEIAELKADLEQSERVIEARLDVIDQQAARIKELEEAHKRSGAKYAKIINELRSSVYANIPGLDVGKIGPDAKPQEGLYGKYCISKADGSPVDPNADYFVLRLDTDPVARRAAREYSYMTVDRKLALDLQERITKYNPKMMDCINLQFFGVEKPRVWQITEERMRAIRMAEELAWDCKAVAVLRAMLKEAGL